MCAPEVRASIDYVQSVSEPAIVSAPLPLPLRKLERRSGGRIVGGVAGGIADHLGVDVLKVRVAFAILAAMAGAGIVVYGILWAFVSVGTDTEKASAAERQRAYGLIALGLGGAAALSWLFSGTAGSVLAPFFVVAIGAALVWREFDSEGPRTVIGLPQRPTVLTWTRVVGGATLIVLGLAVVVLAQVDIDALRSSFLAVIVTLIGAGLLTVPLWLRMWRALGAERAARIRNDEREEIASHLHDSVLQTLALIQKQSENPAEVARLARGQERELRKWLFSGGEIDHTSLTEGLKIIAGEVEDQHGVTVRPVTVGDVALGGENGLPKEAFTALLGATREALVNSAKHSGEKEINLFAEVEGDQVSIFVRDRGVGFDVDAVPEDRQGLAKSIRGRIERRGGRVVVRSSPGKGTEIRVHMPLGGKADLQWDESVDHAPNPEEQF
ncbi:ATP-binding protein [Rhodococcus sp. OK302]|uniref:ATP-binding protein n=1 Tax=Rhodococcus sp. OK302 TaxID=1882769 RepID=UPI000B94497E|nr:ATP-binding protein [Rhodococcus sp. OK302]OYD69035.1 phage shock protein C (PspC) family protein [Rhodococcus sp. OK302]